MILRFITFLCLLKFVTVAKSLLHTLQKYGFSPKENYKTTLLKVKKKLLKCFYKSTTHLYGYENVC